LFREIILSHVFRRRGGKEEKERKREERKKREKEKGESESSNVKTTAQPWPERGVAGTITSIDFPNFLNSSILSRGEETGRGGGGGEERKEKGVEKN